MICNFCRSKDFSTVAEYTRMEKNNVLQCKACGLVCLEIKKSKSEVEAFYSSAYRKITTLPVKSPDQYFYDRLVNHNANNYTQFIQRHLDIKGKRILDVGSASGILMEKLRESGCQEVIGIEPDRESSEYAQGRGFQVFTNLIEDLTFKEEFDAVVSFHTLEHVYDPIATIRAIHKALKEGGCFLGEVPNQDDWRIQIFDDEVIKRFHYDPNHYYYYSPVTLTNYLARCGFKNIKLETIERYNSLRQLKELLCEKRDIEETLDKYVFPKTDRDMVELPESRDKTENLFNAIFEKGVNSVLRGNCLRWTAWR